ncbi:hypothetical protein BN1263190184 [Stenotrophomonas maltophilia]|nr:hypothetical protein BN1263190184 [Stenotrophomonas maltophilia]
MILGPDGTVWHFAVQQNRPIRSDFTQVGEWDSAGRWPAAPRLNGAQCRPAAGTTTPPLYLLQFAYVYQAKPASRRGFFSCYPSGHQRPDSIGDIPWRWSAPFRSSSRTPLPRTSSAKSTPASRRLA